MSFKLELVNEIESVELITTTQALKLYRILSRSTVSSWIYEYGNFDRYNKTPFSMSK